MKIKIFNREICVCVLLATNSFMRKKQRRNGDNYVSKQNNDSVRRYRNCMGQRNGFSAFSFAS